MKTSTERRAILIEFLAEIDATVARLHREAADFYPHDYAMRGGLDFHIHLTAEKIKRQFEKMLRASGCGSA